MLRQWKKLQSHSLEWQKCFEHIKTYAVSPSSILKDYYSRLHLKMERTQQILYTTITSHVTPLDQKKKKEKIETNACKWRCITFSLYFDCDSEGAWRWQAGVGCNYNMNVVRIISLNWCMLLAEVSQKALLTEKGLWLYMTYPTSQCKLH